MNIMEHEPVAPQENEQRSLHILDDAFHKSKKSALKLSGPGFEIELPQSVFQALCQVIYHMLRGNAVSIIPMNKEITTQDAADFLNVSRPYLVKLLEAGEIPFVKVGTHRRIKFSDVLVYKKRRDAIRKQALTTMAHISEDAGLYD